MIIQNKTLCIKYTCRPKRGSSSNNPLLVRRLQKATMFAFGLNNLQMVSEYADENRASISIESFLLYKKPLNAIWNSPYRYDWIGTSITAQKFT